MRHRSVSRLGALLLVLTLAIPNLALAQTNQNDDRDRLWNGMLIGALVDGLQSRDASTRLGSGRVIKPRLSGVQMTVRF